MARELEMKVLVSPEEFDRCLSLLREYAEKPGDTYVQVNHYFDTPDFTLASAHSMLRVRRKKNSLYLQYKNKRKRMGSMLLCEEQQALLTEFPPRVDPSLFFEGAPSANCVLLGELVTSRTDFAFPRAVVSFDENYYLGKVDFEIEIEGEMAAIKDLEALLSPLGEDKHIMGKFSRFLNEYKKYQSGMGRRI